MNSKSKNVLGIVGYTFLPTRTGGHRGIDDVYQAVSMKYNTYVLSTKENKANKPIGYELVSNLGSASQPLRYVNPMLLKKVKKLIKDYNIDIVQVDHPYFGWLAYFLKKQTDVKLYVRCHNLEFQRFKQENKSWWPIMQKYERWTYSLADKVLYVSPDDQEYVQQKWNLDNGVLMTFGTWQKNMPSSEEKQKCRDVILKEQNLSNNTRIVNFNGPMDYFANKDALREILYEIAPRVAKKNSSQHIILCGSNFPVEYEEQLNSLNNVTWAGFVDDIEVYLKGADLFWNPIRLGGGIKTKLVQAISLGLDVVSYESGALGLVPDKCGSKLHTVPDADSDAFVYTDLEISPPIRNTPDSFYDFYYWPNIIENADY